MNASRPLLINHFRKIFNEKRKKVINIFTTFSISHKKIKNAIKTVGPNNSWPWPIFTLGPKARDEEGYSRGWVIKVQAVLGHNR